MTGWIAAALATLTAWLHPTAARPASHETSRTAHRQPLQHVWDDLADCEAGGNWHINTGNGFTGGLQFTAGTWADFGGEAYAPTAGQATRTQQITVARRVQHAQGWAAWPYCSLEEGLR